MAQKIIHGNMTLAEQIKSRRNELGLTIEEAAIRAGVGTKTWYRYETGKSIRKDKCKGICRALNWRILPGNDIKINDSISTQEYTNHEAWSSFLSNNFGYSAAVSFATGSDILLDQIKDDLSELASMPAKSHIGQLSISWLSDNLPEQFLMYYDYNFLYQMKCVVQKMRERAKYGYSMEAHSVIEELILYLCSEEAAVLIELSDEINEKSSYTEDWVFDLFGDMDIITFLYSGLYLDSNHSYHFKNWSKQQFHTEKSE